MNNIMAFIICANKDSSIPISILCQWLSQGPKCMATPGSYFWRTIYDTVPERGGGAQYVT